MFWYSHLFQNFPQFIVIHTVKGFGIVNKAEIAVFLELSFFAKMGSINDRNGMDLTEAEDSKKMWHKYTKELYKKDLHDPNNHNGVITHLEPDTLEYKVKWALGSITMNKASGGNGIPVELFQILKDDAVKVLHSTCQ